MTRYAIGFALVFLAVSAAGPAWGEGVGLHGRVFALDENGDVHDVVVGAEIRLVDASGALAARATSGAGGYYRVNLPAGTYSYKVTAKGYKDEDVKRGVRQELSDGFSVFDFALTPGKTETDKPQDGGGDESEPPDGTTLPAAIGTLYGVVHERSSEGTLVGIAGSFVRLARDDGDGDTQVRTGGSGEYEIVLPTGQWHATAYALGYEPLADADVIEIVKGRRTNRDFLFVRPQPQTVPQGQGIRGTIRLLADPDASSRTTPTPTVSIVPMTPKATQGAAPGVDAQGAYRADLAVGRYEVVASAAGYETARSGPRGVYAGRNTQVDLTLSASPAQAPPAVTPPVTPPVRPPTRTPDPVPAPIPDPIPVPKPSVPPTPQPTPPVDRGATLAIQVLERGPDRILRAVAGARIVLGGRDRDGAVLQSDERGWCHVTLTPGAQHIEVHGGEGDTATLGVGFAPAERLVEVVRRDATGSAHLEFLLPVALQVVLGPEETPEPRPGERGDDDPDETDPRPTTRIEVRVVEPAPAERGTQPLDGARVNIMLGDRRVDSGIARGGSFTSKPLPEIEGYYLFAEKEGYHPAEEMTSMDGGPTTVVLHPVESGREPPPRETPPGEPPPREPPDETPPSEQPPRDGEMADLLIRVLAPDGRPLAGATVEVHWGRDEIRARETTRGRDGIVRVRLPRDEYWAFARIEVPGRGIAQGEVGIPREWNPAVPITVRLHLPGGEQPGEPPPPQPPTQPGRTQPTPLQIQVLGPDGRPRAGAQVEVHWGPHGRSQVRGRSVTQGGQGIVRFNLPREEYWARAVAQLPGGGRLVGQEGIGRGWNPAVPIRIRLHQEGGPTPPTPPPRQPTPPPQPGVPKPPPQKPPAAKAQLMVRVSGLDLNAPISTLQPLGGARVTVRGNGGSWSGNTNAGGAWGIALAPGSYQIEVTAAGMERAAQASVNMGARNVTKELTIKLRGPR